MFEKVLEEIAIRGERLFHPFERWSERRNQEIISRYSTKERKFIEKGRLVVRTSSTQEYLEKEWKVVMERLSNHPEVYSKYGPLDIFGEFREQNIEHFLEFGKSGVDILSEVIHLPSLGLCNIIVGYPLKLVSDSSGMLSAFIEGYRSSAREQLAKLMQRKE